MIKGINQGEHVYHGSTVKGLSYLDPRPTLSKDEYIGDYVFATKSKLMAAMYLIPHEVGAQLMGYDEKTPFLAIRSSRSRFERFDDGGSIYTLSSSTFHDSPQIELNDSELVSDKRVTVEDEEQYESLLDALASYDIKLYILDDDDFDDLMSAGKESQAVLSRLVPYTDHL